MYACMFAYVCLGLASHSGKSMYERMYVCVYVCMRMHVCVCMYVYTMIERESCDLERMHT